MDEQEKKKRKEKAYQDYVKTKTPVHKDEKKKENKQIDSE